ncbi:MAG: hypothetical protein U0872_16750 [Planctomycetaceae bacterium]
MSSPADENAVPEYEDFDIVERGFSHWIGQRLGVVGSQSSRRLLKIGLLLALTWLPLAALSLMAGQAWGTSVKVPFFLDPEVHARLLFALPLLELGEVVVAFSLRVQARHLVERGVVPARCLPEFRAAQAAVAWLRDSVVAEVGIVVLSYFLSILFRLFIGIDDGASSWERTEGAVTAAGWWHMLVSLPFLYFFLLRWLLVLVSWATFLYLVSRIPLELTPTHPDHTGGLGFLGWGLASFAAVLMATSAVFSAGFATEIIHKHESLNSLKYHVAAFVVIALVILHAPLLAFVGQLARCRFKGLLEFGALVWRHDRAFDEKWIHNAAKIDPASILGTADVQSMADLASCYDHINEMWPMPFDVKAFAVLVLAALLPMLPLLATAIPVQEILLKLGELLV